MDAEPLYPTVKLVAGVAECYHKTSSGEMCSCPIGVEGGEEKVAIVYFGGALGNRCSRAAVHQAAYEIARRYNAHQDLVEALTLCRIAMQRLVPEDSVAPEWAEEAARAADACLCVTV